MIDRRLVLGVDWVLLGAALVLAAIGVAMILSATHETRLAQLHLKQLYAIGLGAVGLLAALSVDYRRLADRAPLFFAVSDAVLGYMLVLGPRIAGTRRWLVVGGFQIQPSELVKVAAALLAAKLFAELRKETLGLLDVVGPGSALGLLAVL